MKLVNVAVTTVVTLLASIGNADPEPKPLWYVAHEKARDMIASWAHAQSMQDVAAYAGFYATPDPTRGQTFAGSPRISFGIPSIGSGGASDTIAIADLMEHTSRGGFADHSAKALVIEAAGSRPQILSETTQWSRPGWDEAEVPIFDAMNMTSPISVVIRTADAGDCVNRAAVVELTDGAGVKTTLPLRSDMDRATATHALTRSRDGYSWSDTCPGLRVNRAVWTRRDRLTLREEWSDGAGRSGNYTHIIAILPSGSDVRLR